ncbi:MAG TPA: response regulator transcription factor [Solirubrobacteraceae bacterium]
MTAAPLRVVVGEDQLLLREGMVHVLNEAGFDVVGVANNASDLMRKTRARMPDVAVVDIRMPGDIDNDGLHAAHEIRSIEPRIAVLVLSQFFEDRYALDLLGDRPNGVGYLLKDGLSDLRSFTDAVRRVASGESVIDATIVGGLIDRWRTHDLIDDLTARELEVLALMAQGRSNVGIAEVLVVTVSAVERNVTRIFTKLALGQDSADHRRVLAVLRYLRR